MNHAAAAAVNVPYAYSMLSHIIGVFTVGMAVTALIRLRPARRRSR
jgi:hypothetical protein